MNDNTLVSKLKRNIDRVKTIKKSSGKNLFSTLRYIVKMMVTRGFVLQELNDFEFERFPNSYMDDFLNGKEQCSYLSLLNPRKYYSVARNKYWTHLYFDQLGIKDKPRLLCYYNPELRLYNNNSTSFDLTSTISVLQNKGVSKCVIKTTESSHGDNVVVVKNIRFKNDDALLVKFNNEEIKLSQLLRSTPLIFESQIIQTQQISKINPSSVNTVRFMTTLMPDGSVKVIATFIKIGRAGHCVDNAGNGGNVDACIDVETGELKYAIQYDGWRRIKDIDNHPDTNERINGIIIDRWDEIKKKVVSFQQALPFVKAAGWDIAITDDGPVIIEVNDMWDRTGQLFIRRGWKPEILECYNQWKQYYKK